MGAQFEATCQGSGVDPAERLCALLQLADDASVADEVESFWAQAKENLEQGHLRLLFVADVFPPETKRIIEFLNEKMTDVEVLAVEIRQFTGEGRPILVPRLYGQSEVSRQRKAGPRPRAWDETRCFEQLERNHPELLPVARRIYDWALGRGLTLTWGTGVEIGSMSFRTSRTTPRIASLMTDGRIEFAFGGLKAPFDDLEARRALIARFAGIPGFRFPSDVEIRYPSVPLALLLDDAVLRQFQEALEEWAHLETAYMDAGGSGV